MAVYIIMLIISVFFASCAAKIKHKTEYRRAYRIYAVLSCLPFFIVSAIRYEVGTDWYIYDRFFTAINKGTDKFKEPLFNLLNRVIYLFTDDSQFLFIAVAGLILSFTFLAIYKQSVYIPFSILLFFLTPSYFNSLNQLRQAVAMSIFLFASQYLWKRDWKKYFLWIIIATTIHISALVYVPVYFLYGMKAEIKKHIMLLIVGVPAIFVGKELLIKLISFTPYAWYFDSEYTSNDFMFSSFIVSLFFLVLYEYYNYVGNRNEDKMFSLMVNMQLLSLVCILCTGFIPQVSRISTAFEALTILTIPKMVLYEKKRNQRIIIYMLCVSLLLVALIYEVYICGFYDVVPYKTIFSKTS